MDDRASSSGVIILFQDCSKREVQDKGPRPDTRHDARGARKQVQKKKSSPWQGPCVAGKVRCRDTLFRTVLQWSCVLMKILHSIPPPAFERKSTYGCGAIYIDCRPIGEVEVDITGAGQQSASEERTFVRRSVT